MVSSIISLMTDMEFLDKENNFDEEINLRLIFKRLYRKKKIIFFATFVAALGSFIYGNIKKPIWQGQFQIVLSKKNANMPSQTSLLLQAQPGLSSLIGNTNNTNQLKTEVSILKSPSVLQPVFNFVKSEKKKQDKNSEYWRFNDWRRSNLTVELEKGTSVLNIFYRDSNREILLPVLEKISKEYKSYSGRDRQKGITQAIKFTNQQIDLYTKKSQDAYREAQTYASKFDLIPFSSMKNESKGTKSFNQGNIIEILRSETANEIRNIEEQLNQLNLLNEDDDNSEVYINLGKTITDLKESKLFIALSNLEFQLTNKRTQFKESDISIQNLIKQKRILIKTLKKQINGILSAQLIKEKAKLSSLERPEKVLIKYRELLRESELVEQILTQLEIQFQTLALEKARVEEPWELISKPSILDAPVGPRKLRILGSGIFLGFVFSVLSVLYYYKRQDILFEREEFEKIINNRLLYEIESDDNEILLESIAILSSEMLDIKQNQSLGIIKVFDDNSSLIDQIRSSFSKELKNKNVLISKNLLEIRDSEKIILIVKSGYTKQKELEKFINNIKLLNININGWLFFK